MLLNFIKFKNLLKKILWLEGECYIECHLRSEPLLKCNQAFAHGTWYRVNNIKSPAVYCYAFLENILFKKNK